MFEKDLSIGFLLDFYGNVLSEHTRSLLSLYYLEDLSLAEIAADAGISRQGVRHAIKKGEEELRFLEAQLGLAARFVALQEVAERLRLSALPLLESEDAATEKLAAEAMACAALIVSDNE